MTKKMEDIPVISIPSKEWREKWEKKSKMWKCCNQSRLFIALMSHPDEIKQEMEGLDRKELERFALQMYVNWWGWNDALLKLTDIISALMISFPDNYKKLKEEGIKVKPKPKNIEEFSASLLFLVEMFRNGEECWKIFTTSDNRMTNKEREIIKFLLKSHSLSSLSRITGRSKSTISKVKNDMD